MRVIIEVEDPAKNLHSKGYECRKCGYQEYVRGKLKEVGK